MKRYLSLAPFLFLARILSTPLFAASVLYNNGSPDLRSGFEMTHWIDANQFTVSSPVSLTSVTFWEVEAASDFQGVLVWELLADDGQGNPGGLITFGTSTNLTHFSTGRIASPKFPEYINTFDIKPATLQPGTYWLALHNGYLTYTTNKNIFWETAASSSTVTSRSDAAPFSGVWGNNYSNSQLAFQILGFQATRITAVDDSQSAPTITFTTVAGQNYRVEYRDSLTDSTWTVLPSASSIAGTGSAIQVSDTTAMGLSRRYYHVVIF